MLINMLVSDFRCRYYKAFTTITLFFQIITKCAIMSFNQILKQEKGPLNHERAMTFQLTSEMELYTAVCSMALEPKFY